MYTKDKSNNLTKIEENIGFRLSFNSTDGLTCDGTIGEYNTYYDDSYKGTISGDNNEIKATVNVYSNSSESLVGKSITIIAETTGTFKKKLYATYTFKESETLTPLEQNGIRFEDEIGREYCTLIVNNIGGESKTYPVNFLKTDNTEDILIDSTNSILAGSTKGDANSNGYIDSITFSVPENSSVNIKFYKKYKDQKYEITTSDEGVTYQIKEEGGS